MKISKIYQKIKNRKGKLINMGEKIKNYGFKKQIHVTQRGYSIVYIEKAKVIVENGTLVYVQRKEEDLLYFNIPYMNTAVIMLGTGTSITNEAIRLAADNSLIIMFVNSIYKPSASTDPSMNILTPTSEYKPTEYMRVVVDKFYNERLITAKELFSDRQIMNQKLARYFEKKGIVSSALQQKISEISAKTEEELWRCSTIEDLTLLEARAARSIITACSKDFDIQFKRDPKKYEGVNRKITDQNYMCYGMAASALTTMGISFAFPFFHGRTRRGALVFDIADIVKTGLLPYAFYAQKEEYNEKDFRTGVLEIISDNNLFKFLFEEIKERFS